MFCLFGGFQNRFESCQKWSREQNVSGYKERERMEESLTSSSARWWGPNPTYLKTLLHSNRSSGKRNSMNNCHFFLLWYDLLGELEKETLYLKCPYCWFKTHLLLEKVKIKKHKKRFLKKIVKRSLELCKSSLLFHSKCQFNLNFSTSVNWFETVKFSFF